MPLNDRDKKSMAVALLLLRDFLRNRQNLPTEDEKSYAYVLQLARKIGIEEELNGTMHRMPPMIIKEQ